MSYLNLFFSYIFNPCTYVGVAETVLPSSISTEAINCLSQRSSLTPVITSPRIDYSPQNISSQPTSSVTVISDTHTTFSSSPVATSISGCLTPTSDSVNSSGPVVSTITPTASMYVHIQHLV